jgi:uncharacterized membrane protein
MKEKKWLFYSILTTLFWGVWGALIEIPEKNGFPATLGYSVWALTMIPCSLFALKKVNWKIQLDSRSIIYAGLVGLTGAGGQLLLFQALRFGPAYLVFPFISLYPVLTIVLSVTILKERASKRGWVGILFALIAIFLLSFTTNATDSTDGWLWLLLAIMVFIAWGIQAFIMKKSNQFMDAESIFFYMMITAIMLVPVAIYMTDFSLPINYGWDGPYLAFAIQILNAIGALSLVYAVRYGKAIIVVPMTSLAPVITIVLSLIIYGVMPQIHFTVGIVLAIIAIYLMAE